MKRELYVNFMICYYMLVPLSVVNQLSSQEKDWYMEEIERYRTSLDDPL